MYLFQENAALLDEIAEVQELILIKQEERKYLLKKLCQYEPQTEMEVESLSKKGFFPASNSVQVDNSRKVVKRRSPAAVEGMLAEFT